MCRFVAGVLGRLRAFGEDRGARDCRCHKMAAAARHGFGVAQTVFDNSAANFAHRFIAKKLARWELLQLEHAQQMAAHESARTTKLYYRRNDKVTLDEVEKIML
jgi:hypothetical protein